MEFVVFIIIFPVLAHSRHSLNNYVINDNSVRTALGHARTPVFFTVMCPGERHLL